MNHQPDPVPYDSTVVLSLVQQLHGDELEPLAITRLAHGIVPYLARTRLPLSEAVSKISTNYLKEYQRVQHLLANPAAPEWQHILMHVITFATKHSLYPKDVEVRSWPDLDAYEDIRHKLASYNFEGSLDNWITVTVVNRLRRFWRDQNALKLGGQGFKLKEDRAAATPHSHYAHAVQRYVLASTIEEQWLNMRAGWRETSVADHVEATELRRMVMQRVVVLAQHKRDHLLPHIWNAVVEQQLKLREAADRFGLTISQVYSRLDQARDYLRQDPGLSVWFNRTADS